MLKSCSLAIVSFTGFFIFTIRSACSQTLNLDYYLEAGIKNSPLLYDYRNQVQASKTDSSLIKAGYKPQVNASSSGTYAPIINGTGYDAAISNGQTLSALISVNQSVTSRKTISSQLQNIALTADSIRNASQLSHADLKRTITTQYITAYASQQQLDFNQKVYDLLKREEIILKKLTRDNVYKQTDYLTFLVSYQQQGLQLEKSRITFLNDLATLNYVCGLRDTTFQRLGEPDIILQPQPALAETESLFFRKYYIDSLRLQNEKRLIDINYRPKAGISADAGYISSFAAPFNRNFGTSAGFTISVPIYDGHKRKMEYSKITLGEKTRLAYRDFFTNQYKQQIAQLTQQLRHTEGLYVQINQQIRFTENLIKVNEQLLQTGNLLIADYIIAINNYLNAQNLLRETNITRLQLITQLNYWNQ